jgi:hypothetical protein
MRSSTPIDSSRSSASDHPLGSNEARADEDEKDAEVEVGNEEGEDEEDDEEEEEEARYRGGVRWRC